MISFMALLFWFCIGALIVAVVLLAAGAFE